jgi:sigma-B regulation protein RsbU (phosphoserine phosphatase)
VLYLDTQLGRADFNASHLEVVTILAGMANVVLEVESTRSYREQIQRMETQLHAAADIQSALLPSGRVDLPGGFSAASFHHACQTVGGDFFDFFHAGEQIGVMLADVAGKGLPAALLMANLHARWHGVRLVGIPPEEWLSRLNEQFLANNVGNRFITLAFAMVAPSSDELFFASAGHNPTVMVHGAAMELLDATGPILGILPRQEFGSCVRPFHAGARLVVYSDGITDQQDTHGEPFGMDRLCASVRASSNGSPEQIVARIREDLETFAGEAPQDDDTTITVLGRDA